MRWLALVILLASCQGKGGAVSVRWRLRDLTTGEQFNPRDVGVAGGACAHQNPTWTIQDVSLVLADPATGVPMMSRPEWEAEFDCSQREGTTPFELPVGTFALSIQPTTVSPEGGAVAAAPQVREIRAGEIVNLDIVEIGVNPLPLGAPDGGATD